MNKVGIVGGAGFIGSHITKIFLNEGFDVKVSTRNISNKSKYQHLMNFEHSDKLHICELDITKKISILDFVKNCDIIIHSGTPFLLEIEDIETELLTPIIEGSKSFLNILELNSFIKKIVFVASITAWNTNFPLPAKSKDKNDIFDESTPPFFDDESHPYAKAKFEANKIVNTFIQNNPYLNTDIISISPVLVMGQSLSYRKDSTSINLQYLIKQKIISNNFVQMLFEQNTELAIVNVKDVALAAFKAATIPWLHGKNFIISSESYPTSDIHLMLNHKHPQNEPKLIYQNQMAQQKLGIPFISVATTLSEYTSISS